MATISHHGRRPFPARQRHGARAAAARGVSILPLLALTFATLETAVLFAGENLLRVLGVTH